MRGGLPVLLLGLFACASSDDFPKASQKDAAAPTTQADDDASAPAATSDGGADAKPDQPTSEDFTGEATYYDADGTGACGFGKSTDFLVAALNESQYAKSECGKCAFVKGPNGSVTVRIVDLCPGCKSGDLDLSETAFSKIAKLDDGRVAIKWHFSTCP